MKAFFTITTNEAFLENNPSLARSIRNRFPYLDPLNHLQVELLKRYRAGDSAEQGAPRHPPHHQRPRRGPAQLRLTIRDGSTEPVYSECILHTDTHYPNRPDSVEPSR